MYGTRDAASNFAAIVMNALTNMKPNVGEINLCSCKHASKDMRLFYHSDDFVMLADENSLQWFAKELNEASMVNVCMENQLKAQDVPDILFADTEMQGGCLSH